MALAGAAVALGGCAGTGSDGAGGPRTVSPMVVTASIGDQRVSVSPRLLGAGPISLIVTNQTATAQRVTLESAARPGQPRPLRQETSPISPADTATLTALVAPGRYLVHVRGDGIRAGRLRVGVGAPGDGNAPLQR
jgi:hypothetical protein